MVLGILTGFLRLHRCPTTGFKSQSAKRGPRGYFKGKRCINYGRKSDRGGFIVDLRKLPRFIVPDLTGFKLKPYVAHNVPLIVTEDKFAALRRSPTVPPSAATPSATPSATAAS